MARRETSKAHTFIKVRLKRRSREIAQFSFILLGMALMCFIFGLAQVTLCKWRKPDESIRRCIAPLYKERR